MSAIDLRPVLRSQYASDGNLFEPDFSDSAYELVLGDADHRINRNFRVPREMRPLVGFWLKIYTRYTTHHRVFFDSRHPEIIYDVMDFSKIAETARNLAAYEITVNRKVTAAVAAYKKAFHRLARNPKPKNPTPEEKSILSALASARHKHGFAELSRNLRTQTGQRDNIIKGLLAAETYFPKMEQIFSKFDVPLELTRIALVESSFNPKAVSKAGAVGVWQFMLNSGREYLVIDDSNHIDERLSPLKASVAAAKLLKRSFRIFGNWPVATTSYNHGTGGLPRKLTAADGELFGDADFSKIAHLFAPCSNKRRPLGWASRNYYAEFLAVLHAESYRSLFYGEPPIVPMGAIAFHRIQKSKPAIQIAMERGIPLQEFRRLNPDVKDVLKALPVGFRIALPDDSDSVAGLLSPTKIPSRQTRSS